MFCNFPKLLHSWSKWETTKQGEIGSRVMFRGAPVEGSQKVTGTFIEQRRECSVCGRVQLRTESAERK
jgi:hypothetical protein